MRVLFNMSRPSMTHLFEHHYLNDESRMVWTMDSIRAYRLPRSDDRLDENQNNEDADSQIRDWLEASEEPEDSFEPISEDMTSEQRTIQWAIQNGGANNL